jgi:N6-L-threonylcarbamoyladenine synthase
MKILAIETSCDDTCIALAETSAKGFRLLSNIISSQTKIHRKWGGVYPALARREHQKNLTPLLAKALQKANLLSPADKKKKIKTTKKALVMKDILEREKDLYKPLKKFLEKEQKPKIDLIAVTHGPGLDPCLWTGVNFAKALAHFWNLPIIGINHIEGHIIANLLPQICSKSKILRPISEAISGLGKNRKHAPYKIEGSVTGSKIINFPAVCLVVSGGHTQLILIERMGKYKILGETRDDAAGEAFDKIARILGLPYPGGPSIAAVTAKFSDKLFFERKEKKYLKNSSRRVQIIKVCLPRPMMYTKDYDFSFSGLKTAVLYDYKKRTKKQRESQNYVGAMASEAQQAIVDVLVKKTIKAAKDHRIKSILLGGGVAANKLLKKSLQEKVSQEKQSFQLHFCKPIYYTDNAAMIAAAAFFHWSRMSNGEKEKAMNWKQIKAEPNLRI